MRELMIEGNGRAARGIFERFNAARDRSLPSRGGNVLLASLFQMQQASDSLRSSLSLN
jgi:hypothetical protein